MSVKFTTFQDDVLDIGSEDVFFDTSNAPTSNKKALPICPSA